MMSGDWPGRSSSGPMARVRDMDVLLGLGCCNQVPQTDGLDSRYVFLPALETGAVSSGCQRGWVPARTQFLLCRWPSSPCVLIWWRENELLDVSSYKGINPIIRVPAP